MKPIEEDTYLNARGIYDLKQTDANTDNILDYEINVKELHHKYKFSHEDKALILHASLERKKENPDIRVIKQAISLISKYESHFFKTEQNRLKHQEHRGDRVRLSSELKEEIWKPTLLSLFFAPFGLLTVSWKLFLFVLFLSIAMFYILPELLVSIPLISSALAWVSVKKKINSRYYHKVSGKEEPVFHSKGTRHFFSEYSIFLKKKKTVWLAALLAFVLNGFGLFYVSWIFAVGMLAFMIATYISFPILLISTPFLSIGLGLFTAIETNNKLSYMNRSSR